MTTHPSYYRAQPFGRCRWIVTHRVPGMTYLECIDLDCPSQASAEREAARMNAAHEQQFSHAGAQQQPQPSHA